MGDKPKYKLIRKEGEKWQTIGAGWDGKNGNINMSIELVRGGEKIKCLLVENKEPQPRELPKNYTPVSDVNDEIPF